jgi:endogenous inhibitor of DNA gyrase (YacG/DUF329 family)
MPESQKQRITYECPHCGKDITREHPLCSVGTMCKCDICGQHSIVPSHAKVSVYNLLPPRAAKHMGMPGSTPPFEQFAQWIGIIFMIGGLLIALLKFNK